jgi:undecaprenyl-diphosphatase
MGLFASIGLIGAVFLAKLFEELAEGIFRKESTELDNRFGLWVHSFANPTLDKVFKFFTTIGSMASVIIMTVFSFGLLVRRNHPNAAWLIALSSGGGILINQVLKFFFRRPRPALWNSQDPQLPTFSFPSGHATVSFCFCGGLSWLGYKFIKNPIVLTSWLIGMLVCVIMVGLSRIYRGVHYLTDVVGGYISGSFWLALLLSGVSIYDRIRSQPEVQKE